MLSPKVLDKINDDQSSWEDDVLPILANENQLSAFKHSGFWQPMDTLREKNMLNKLWVDNRAPWKVWK